VGQALTEVMWHDLECGGYVEDLPLWRELAGAGPVLDLGCGTGRVALDLAAHGVPVVGLDLDQVLLDELERRAGDLPVETVRADARDFDLGRRFPVALAPMQTMQLLGGPEGRAGLLRCAKAHLEPGGVLALAIADVIETFDDIEAVLPDVHEHGGTVYFSQPVSIRDQGDRFEIEFVREVVDAHGGRDSSRNVIHLDRLDADRVEAEADGFIVLERRSVPATDAYVGSTVVMLRA
jgi:SAM-dependent methyltransferase